MYSINFTRTSEKQFDKLPSDIRVRVLRVLERIKIRPFHFVKRKEGTPYFVMRVGEYRVVLDINSSKKIINVMEMGHRKNIYKS